MIIEWDGRDYHYDPSATDVKSAIKISEYVGCGLRSWEKLIDDAHPKALQALLWEMKRQAGEVVHLPSLEFSYNDFYKAMVDAAAREIAARLVEAEERGEEVDPANPTVTADE